MSHFSKIETELTDEECLKKALADLGYRVELGGQIRGYHDQRTKADLVIRQEGGYDIGFLLQDGQFQMVADLWGLKVDKDEFLQRVKQRYAYHTVLDQAAAEQFTIVSQQELEDGSIRIVVEREGEAAQA